eukprot:TRINITY_DN1941_c0_g1_i8.p1 TRINITY_DN1941_c0_g1~~TRINITY_DN1941_c0_g1_i8.p1  ORF type:complete len:553 (-),score=193.06 TRINITY_DN1941_c0_g1_i8:197-1855(-)
MILTPNNRAIPPGIAAKRLNRVYSWDYTNSPPSSPKATPLSSLSKSVEPQNLSSNPLIPVSVISSPKIWRTRSKLTAEPKIPLELYCPFRLTEAQDSIFFQKNEGDFLTNPIHLCFMKTKCLRTKQNFDQIIDLNVNGEMAPIKIVFNTEKSVRFVYGEELEDVEDQQHNIKKEISLQVSALPSIDFNSISPFSSPGTPRFRKAISDSNLKESLESVPDKAPIDISPFSPRAKVSSVAVGVNSTKSEMRCSSESTNTAKAFAAATAESLPNNGINQDLFEMFNVSLLPNSKEAQMMNLKTGKNQITLVNRTSGIPITTRIFVLPIGSKLILVDVDAAIIKKMDPSKKKGWRSDHETLADALQSCDSNGYQIIYYSHRTIKLAHQTCMLLDLAGFPTGPVLLTVPNLYKGGAESTQLDAQSQLEEIYKNLRNHEDNFGSNQRHTVVPPIWPKWILQMVSGGSTRRDHQRRRGSKEEIDQFFCAAFGDKEDKSFYHNIQVPSHRTIVFGSKNTVSIQGTSKSYSGGDLKRKMFSLFPKINHPSSEKIPHAESSN